MIKSYQDLSKMVSRFIKNGIKQNPNKWLSGAVFWDFSVIFTLISILSCHLEELLSVNKLTNSAHAE